MPTKPQSTPWRGSSSEMFHSQTLPRVKVNWNTLCLFLFICFCVLFLPRPGLSLGLCAQDPDPDLHFSKLYCLTWWEICSGPSPVLQLHTSNQVAVSTIKNDKNLHSISLPSLNFGWGVLTASLLVEHSCACFVIKNVLCLDWVLRINLNL